MPEKILVVEDTLDMRELFHLHLTAEGYNVIVASDGREGLYLARAEQPDLIITDINMPNLNGLDMIRELRAMPECGEVPILALTAFGGSMAEEALEAGANRAMFKPTLFDSLVSDVKTLLSEARHRRKKKDN